MILLTQIWLSLLLSTFLATSLSKDHTTVQVYNRLYPFGRPHVLCCIKRSSTVASNFIWKKDNAIVRSSARYQINLRGDRLKVALRNETQGVYKCYASIERRKILLSVTYFYSGSQRLDLGNIENPVLMEQNEDWLQFFKYKNFLPEVRHSMNCSLLKNGAPVLRATCMIESAKGVVKLGNITKEDVGLYQVKVESIIGNSLSEELHLKVITRNKTSQGLFGSISDSNEVKLIGSSTAADRCIEVGDNINLVCLHPPLTREGFKPTVQWEVNGSDVDLESDGFACAETYTSTASILTWNVITSDSLNFSCCLIQVISLVHVYSNSVIMDIQSREKPLRPNIKKVQPQMSSISLTWEHDPVCFEDYTFSFTISWCTVRNGVPDVSTCNSTTTSTTDITLSNLVPSTTYQVNTTAQSVENSTIRSDTVEMEVITLNFLFLGIPKNSVCYDRQVQLTCHHHDITDTTSSGPIFNQTSPVVWMKDGERIDLPDTYHMVVSQNNTETVVSVTTKKSVFLNGEVNYSCAVVYADGSMEESEPVTVRIRVLNMESLTEMTIPVVMVIFTLVEVLVITITIKFCYKRKWQSEVLEKEDPSKPKYQSEVLKRNDTLSSPTVSGPILNSTRVEEDVKIVDLQKSSVLESYLPNSNRSSVISSFSFIGSEKENLSCSFDSITISGEISSCGTNDHESFYGVSVKTLHEGYLSEFNLRIDSMKDSLFKEFFDALKRKAYLQDERNEPFLPMNVLSSAEIKRFWSVFDLSMLEKLHEYIRESRLDTLTHQDSFIENLVEILQSYEKTISKKNTSLASIQSPETEEELSLRRPPGFSLLKIRLLHKAEDLFLQTILYDVKDSICVTFKLPEYLVLLAGYQSGSVILWFYIPKNSVPLENCEESLWNIFEDLRKRKGMECNSIHCDEEPSVTISYDIANPEDMEMVAPVMRRLTLNKVRYHVNPPSASKMQTNQPSLRDINNYMPRLSLKAREIGIALGRENYPNELQGYDNMLILERVIKGWITSGNRCVGDTDITVTWDYFLSVLRSPAVDVGGIADEIEREVSQSSRKRKPLQGGSDGEYHSSSTTGYDSFEDVFQGKRTKN